MSESARVGMKGAWVVYERVSPRSALSMCLVFSSVYLLVLAMEVTPTEDDVTAAELSIVEEEITLFIKGGDDNNIFFPIRCMGPWNTASSCSVFCYTG